MKKLLFASRISALAFLLLVFLPGSRLRAQNQSIPVHPTVTGTGTFLGISPALRDLPALSPEQLKQLQLSEIKKNEEQKQRTYPFSATALPKGDDGAWQKQMGTNRLFRGPLVSFEGQTSQSEPPDDNGAVGPNHYMQTINSTYAIYSRSGTLLAGPTNLNLIFGNVPGADRNDGDPVILYDRQADRWLVTEFSVPKPVGQDYILMAVSTTNDPTGTWYKYSFPADKMPDYPKFSVWRDGYYMGDNNANITNDTYVYERSKMLIGETPQMVGFKNPNRPGGTGGFRVVPPVTNDGNFAPEGSPGLYISFNDDIVSGGIDQLWISELAVNWSDLPASTFNRVQQLSVTPFNSKFDVNWDDIRQKGTTQRLDANPSIIMNMPQYRNFGSYQTIVCCHTVNVDGNARAGIRWYELRKTDGDWFVRQQSTYSPDTNSRWMGSILLNSQNTIALAYSVSSGGEYPGIRYCGQSAQAFLAGNSTMDVTEDTIVLGNNSQTVGNRWGDYSSLSLDPNDDETFWYTNEYEGSDGRHTKIAAFKVLSPSGIDQVAAGNDSRVNIFPNPTQGLFRIVPLKAAEETLDVIVEDLSGRVILNEKLSGKKEYVMDLSKATDGVYHVIVKAAGWRVSTKLVLAR